MDADEHETWASRALPDGGRSATREIRPPEHTMLATAALTERSTNGRANGHTNGRHRPDASSGVVLDWPSDERSDPASRQVYLPRWQRRLKRALDLVVAPIVLAVVSPVLAVSVIAIRLETPGPVIFRQRRVGAGGRPFVVLKLRTMYDGNDDGHHRDYVAALLEGRAERRHGLFKLADDHRITRVGRVLRSFSLDEVPQLVNVLRGEMTLVGPRPAPPAEVEMYDRRQRGRLAGTPGITGLWQVSGRSELGYREMIDLDLAYLDRWSVWGDLRILLRTPFVVLSRKGAA